MAFWRRVLQRRFRPLAVGVSRRPSSTLIARALPWTVGLLAVGDDARPGLLGNLLGGLAGYYQESRSLKLLGVIAMALHPVPYYIVALVLLIVFGYLWPVLPITGGHGMNMQQGFNWTYSS